MTDVLFVKTSSLGDVIHHMPALAEARARMPNARFTWVVEEAFAPLVRLHTAVDEVIAVAARRWRRSLHQPATWREIISFARLLRARRFDKIVDTQGLIKSALIARAARGPKHGYDRGSIKEPAASLFYDIKHTIKRNIHAIERNRALTAAALGYAMIGPLDYGLDRACLQNARSAPYALLLHATARTDKEWPEENWRALIAVLGGRDLNLVVLHGSDVERDRALRIASASPRAQVPDRQPLDQVARLIAGASLVIGVDTGLLHLAAALSVPLIALFCGSEPGLTGPKGAGPIVVLGGKNQPPTAAEVIAAVGVLATE